jgi:hypothetical protein
MPQDRESGARANEYGRECGKKIIDAIGAKSVKRGSNECDLNGELLSVHCAQKNTDSVGVTYKALDRISAVLGAFEQDDSSYLVWRLTAEQYKAAMKPTKSTGRSHGRVGIVKRVEFERLGTQIARVSIT